MSDKLKKDDKSQEQNQQQEVVKKQLHGGAQWFYWIAALSALNSVLIYTSAGYSFMFGLGFAEVVDYVAL